jgi:hypothetical protein
MHVLHCLFFHLQVNNNTSVLWRQGMIDLTSSVIGLYATFWTAESGDVERLDISKEAQAEIKQAAGAVHEMTKEPAW